MNNNSDIDSAKLGGDWMPMGIERTFGEAIPGTTNLPNVPRAERSFGKTHTNTFSDAGVNVNPGTLGEIDSRTMVPISKDVPGTFTQPGSSYSAPENPFDSPKMGKIEDLCC